MCCASLYVFDLSFPDIFPTQSKSRMSHQLVYAYFENEKTLLRFVVGFKLHHDMAKQSLSMIDQYIANLFKVNDSVLNRSLGGVIQDVMGSNDKSYNSNLCRVSPVFDRSCSMIMCVDCSNLSEPYITRYILGEDRVEYAWSNPECSVTNRLPVSIDEDLENHQGFKKNYKALEISSSAK